MPGAEASGETCAHVGRVTRRKAPGVCLTLFHAIVLRIDDVCRHLNAAVRAASESDEHRAVRRSELCLKGLWPQLGQAGAAFQCLKPVPLGVVGIIPAKKEDSLQVLTLRAQYRFHDLAAGRALKSAGGLSG